MVKYAANLSMLYTEVDVLDRFKKAAEAGFTHVEMLFPFHYDLDRIERELKSNGLTMILFDTDAGDLTGPLDAGVVDAVRAVPGVTIAEPDIQGVATILGTDGRPVGGNGPPTIGV